MIVYHGSDSNFKKLRISKDLVKHRSTLDNEGLGIYFSTDISVAENYGKYIYVLEINDSCFHDFRQVKQCEIYVRNICYDVLKKTGVDISKYIDISLLILYMKTGGIAISGVGREIYMLLDSNENWFKLSKSKIQAVYRLLSKYDKFCPKAYMFTYHISNIGVIKDVSEDVVRIIDKKRR